MVSTVVGHERQRRRAACRDWLAMHGALSNGLPDASGGMLPGEADRLAAVAQRMIALGFYSRATEPAVVAWSIRVHMSELRGRRVDHVRRWTTTETRT